MKEHLRNGDYLTCCQLIKYKLGSEWISFVEEKFLSPNFKPHKIHEIIFNLDSSIVLTPNFDRIYDNYANSATQNLVKIKRYYDEDIPRALRGGDAQQRLIIKIHGCIDAPDKLIFTREDYADIRHRNSSFYRVIDSLIFTHTFLFIGCGLSDPDLALVLEQYARSFSSTPPHYILFSKILSSDYKNILQKNYNVKVINYSSKDQHKELVESLEALVQLVDTRRGELAKTMLW
jgi:hypothetical protein